MTLLTGNNFVDFTGIIISLMLVLFTFMKWRYTYWKRKGIPYLEPTFPLGNAQKLLARQRPFGEVFKEIYDGIKSRGEKHVGCYFLHIPQYIPADPELIKHILQKDFNHFVDRGVFSNEKDEPLGVHLFSMEGTKWKTYRSKLSPTFTSGKMKMMFPHVVNACDELTLVLGRSAGREAVEIKELLARLTTDIIGNVAFGIECNSLKNPDVDFRKYGKRIFEQNRWQQLKMFVSFLYPDLMRKLRVTVMNKEVAEFFMSVIRETVEYREKHDVRRNDFMHLLLQVKNRGRVEEDDTTSALPTKDVKSLTVEEISGQAFVFFFAGFETSSTTMGFALYELACNQDVQEKLRQEIKTTLKRHGGNLTYEALSEMQYLDMVVSETLRKYPPLPVLNRICTKTYEIPEVGVTLGEGTQLIIPVQGLHHDPEFYPNPEQFDPERFSSENKDKRHPYSYLPFGEGPRICVGMRFGLMQTKAGLSLLLNNFRFRINSKTIQPLQMDPASLMNGVIGGMWMDLSKVKG